MSKVEMLQRKYMEKKRSIVRTVSIEVVLQPRFHYAVNYVSFDAGVLLAFFVFGLCEIPTKFNQDLSNNQ